MLKQSLLIMMLFLSSNGYADVQVKENKWSYENIKDNTATLLVKTKNDLVRLWIKIKNEANDFIQRLNSKSVQIKKENELDTKL